MDFLSLNGILSFMLGLCWKTRLTASNNIPNIWPMETNDIACLTQPCPDPKSTEWQHLQELCCSQGGKFHCQSNDLSLSKRLCMEPIECPAGFYANIMLVSWPFTDESLCQLCPLTEFQPAPTPSHYFTRSHCHKKHTQCPFPQTLTEQFGNSTSEFMCRCNYLNGYRPVPKANHDCKAFASSSDCVCKLDPCPIGQTLNSTDYTCIKLTAEVLEDVQKEASENLLSNLDTLQQQLKRLVDITKRLAEPPKQAEYQWKAAFIPFGEPMCCVEEGKTQPPVTFMSPYPLYFLQDFSSHPFALISEDDLCVSVSPISLIAVLTILLIIAVENIQLFSRSEKKTQVPHTYIRLSLTTKKAMGIVQKEIENILPFLERHYGRLVVSVSPKKRHITLVVKQGQDQTPFPLRTFLRDIFSPLSMKNLKRCEKEADPPVKVFVLTGMTTDLKEIKQKFLTACFQENMAHNKGEITLLLPEKKTQDALLKKLQWTRSSLKDVFSKYHLHLDLVQEGSIRFKLRLASCPETLDELAHDQRIIQITQDLFLHESFRELACGQNLPVQFTCSVKMENVSVLTANNLYVQIGKHNKVTVVASPGHHADGGEDEEKNEESYIIMADNSVDVTATIESVVAFQVIPRKNHPQEQVPDNGRPATTLKKNQMKIVVKCEDERLAIRLEIEWSNVLPLLQNHHPGWRMTRYSKKILWDRTARENVERNQLLSFLCDILAPKRVQHLTRNHFPHIDVNVGEELRHAIDKPPQVQQVQQVQTRRTYICQSLRTAITRHFYKIPLNAIFFCLLYNFLSMHWEEPEQLPLADVTLKPTGAQYTWFFLPYLYNFTTIFKV